VRHYDRGDAQNDPSSPLSGQQLEANWPDTEAVGIVFNWDPGQSKLATIKYLSGNEDALRLFADQFAKIEEGFKPVIRLAEPGVVEMVVNLAERDSPAFLLVLLALLGHAVYL